MPPETAARGPADALDARRIGDRLRALRPEARIGCSIEALPELGSTMDHLAAQARRGAPEGSVVLAEHQRAGRGRLERPWLAPPGRALMLSILFRPACSGLPAERVPQLPMALALAALEAVASHLPRGVEASLKWPNDLLAGERKLAGLLAEADWPVSGDGKPPSGPATIVLGLGLNVHQSASELPEGAASLALLRADRPGAAAPGPDGGLDRSRLAADLLAAVDRRYADLLAGRSLHPDWSARLGTLGREVVARRGTDELHGLAERVTAEGALVLRRSDGRLEVLQAGDVSLRPVDPAEARAGRAD